jgi:large subunit ribosomal protein L25
MKSVSISGSPRVNVGKKDAKAIRSQKMIPCVLYGGKEQFFFTTPEDSFKNIVYTPEICTVKIQLNGKEYNSIMQDIQFHPVTDKILHADFLEIFENKPITMHIPIKTKGTAPGIIKGGKLHLKIKKLKIKGLPKNLPDNITIDISKLDIGDSFRVNEIPSENFTILDAPNNIIASCRITRVVVEEVPEEAEVAATAAAPGTAAAPAELSKEALKEIEKEKEKEKYSGKDKK